MGPGGGGHSMGGPPLPNQTMAQSSILSMIAQQANLTPEQTQQLDYLLTLTPEQVRETLEYTLLAFEHVAKTLEHRDRTAEHRDRACEQVTKHVSTVFQHLTSVTGRQSTAMHIGRERAAGERAGGAVGCQS
jgi:hypothetical protein